ALVLGGRVPQYLPAQSNYTDVRDRATMLFVESAQASSSGALFPSVVTGGAFQPDAIVDRLTAVVALVRAAGLRQQAESGTYTLTYTDAASIPSSLRGYVAVAVQNGLIKTSGMTSILRERLRVWIWRMRWPGLRPWRHSGRPQELSQFTFSNWNCAALSQA